MHLHTLQTSAYVGLLPTWQELLICANFDVSPALHAKLLELVQFLEQADPNKITSSELAQCTSPG